MADGRGQAEVGEAKQGQRGDDEAGRPRIEALAVKGDQADRHRRDQDVAQRPELAPARVGDDVGELGDRAEDHIGLQQQVDEAGNRQDQQARRRHRDDAAGGVLARLRRRLARHAARDPTEGHRAEDHAAREQQGPARGDSFWLGARAADLRGYAGRIWVDAGGQRSVRLEDR